ncbi:MAG: hypothetical protein HY088_07200 [Ignavibacteriales bacterium]|nr:hypothetical protein [Ignavibacteriales bacterium]
MITPRFKVLVSMVLAAVVSRLIPHPPNFTPIIALALFGGAYFENKKIAFAIPLAAMVISDAALAMFKGYTFFSSMRFVIYSCFALITGMGFLLRNKVKVVNVTMTSVTASVVFFVISNFAVWLGLDGGFYPLNLTGLIACYVAAIPFFNNTMFSALIYSAVLFGSFEAAKYKFPVLSKVTA